MKIIHQKKTNIDRKCIYCGGELFQHACTVCSKMQFDQLALQRLKNIDSNVFYFSFDQNGANIICICKNIHPLEWVDIRDSPIQFGLLEYNTEIFISFLSKTISGTMPFNLSNNIIKDFDVNLDDQRLPIQIYLIEARDLTVKGIRFTWFDVEMTQLFFQKIHNQRDDSVFFCKKGWEQKTIGEVFQKYPSIFEFMEHSEYTFKTDAGEKAEFDII